MSFQPTCGQGFAKLKWVLANGPWSFEDHPLALRRWERGMTATSVRFISMPMWVQIWSLPFDLLLEEVGKEIGSGLGEVLGVDLKAFSSDQTRFIRVRVESPLDKPLRRGGVVASLKGDKGCLPYGKWLKAGYRRNHDKSVIPSKLIEVVVMDEDIVILSHDLMGKQGTLIFEGSEIDFMIGCGKVKGNKTTSKGRPKRNGNIDKCVSQSLHSPKRVKPVENSTTGSPKAMMNWKRLGTRPQTLINSSIVDVELGHKRKQAKIMNKETTGAKGEKKYRTMEKEQGVVSPMASMEVARQPCRA
uniref:DUF4283 domain-containing protein n=1 Tax=Quercus lobata TaxID=97700 RepID=A0A7N2R5N8_QUELO